MTVLGLNPSHLSEDDGTLFLGDRDKIELPGFVENDDYQRLISSENLIVLASSDEEFGFPAVEAGYVGIPCLASDDRELSEIHCALVTAAPPEIGAFSQAMATLRLEKNLSLPSIGLQRPWADVATATRDVVLG